MHYFNPHAQSGSDRGKCSFGVRRLQRVSCADPVYTYAQVEFNLFLRLSTPARATQRGKRWGTLRTRRKKKTNIALYVGLIVDWWGFNENSARTMVTVVDGLGIDSGAAFGIYYLE